MLSDDLIHAAIAGDERARSQLGVWLWSTLHEFFSGRFKDSEVDDLVQQTCEDVLQKLEHFEGRAEGFRRWVLRFASFEARTVTRERFREAGRRQKAREQPISPELSPGSVIFEREWREHLAVCLEQLSERQRAAVRNQLEALDKDDMVRRDRELARQLGISVKTVWSHRSLGWSRLRELLGAALVTPAHESTSSSRA